jgi:chromosomal replication initiation ATPase DnaA
MIMKTYVKSGDLNLLRVEKYNKNRRPSSIDQVKKVVSKITNIPIVEIENCTRKLEVVRARQYICLFARKINSKITLEIIGRELGNKDHATVTNALKKAGYYFDAKDKFFMEFYNQIELELGLIN